MSEPVLLIDRLSAGYGDAKAVHEVSMQLAPGETLALIGANGAGKSTLLRAVCGMLAQRSGTVRFRGKAIEHLPADRILALGIAMVPEGRRLFRSLTVEENLLIGGQIRRPGPWNLERVLTLFPDLRSRKSSPATLLSGGQQQMVAIGRALMSNPELLLLDELSLGLAPLVIQGLYSQMNQITANGLSVILVEQDLGRALSTANRFVCMREGRIVLEGSPQCFNRSEISAAYFGS
jgi:branched-chain amino acid transport system ATP-binding protein